MTQCICLEIMCTWYGLYFCSCSVVKDLMGCIIQELCHQHDLQKLANHLKEAVNTGHSTSAPYRLRVTAPDKYVHVQTKSKLFKSNGTLTQEPDFIMATHSIIG
jgi:nuclear receptor coactivator 2